MGTPTVGDNGLEPLRLARRAAEECELPLMVHVAFGPPEIEDVLALMRPGDILTHCFTGLTMKIVDDEGRLYDFARARVGLGRRHGHRPRHRVVRLRDRRGADGGGPPPDVISTDLHQLSINGPAYDLPTA